MESLLATVGLPLLGILIAFLVLSTIFHHFKSFIPASTSSGSSPISVVFLFVLAISPIGAPAIYILLSLLGICSGALGSGVSCLLPGVGGYFEFVGGYLELSFLFFIGFVWLLIAFTLWALLIWKIVKMLQGSK